MKWSTSGPHWILAIGEVRNGKGFFLQGKEPLLCPRNFALYVPPFSLIRSDSRTAEASLKVRIHHGQPSEILPKQSVLFVPANWSLPTKVEKIKDFIESGSAKIKIDVSQAPSYLAEKAKQFIDLNFTKDLKIPDLAFKLKTNPASLSREFQTQTGISLTEYHELLQEAHKLLRTHEEGSEYHTDGLSFLNQRLVE